MVWSKLGSIIIWFLQIYEVDRLRFYCGFYVHFYLQETVDIRLFYQRPIYPHGRDDGEVIPARINGVQLSAKPSLFQRFQHRENVQIEVM